MANSPLRRRLYSRTNQLLPVVRNLDACCEATHKKVIRDTCMKCPLLTGLIDGINIGMVEEVSEVVVLIDSECSIGLICGSGGILMFMTED